MRANFVGRSVVSATTQTPASGPLPLLTTPPMSSASIATVSLGWTMNPRRAIAAAPQFPGGGRFATLVLKEPPKSEVLAYVPGAAVRRDAFAIVLDRAHNRTFEAVVDVRAARVTSWTEVKGVQPAVLDSEYD